MKKIVSALVLLVVGLNCFAKTTKNKKDAKVETKVENENKIRYDWQGPGKYKIVSTEYSIYIEPTVDDYCTIYHYYPDWVEMTTENRSWLNNAYKLGSKYSLGLPSVFQEMEGDNCKYKFLFIIKTDLANILTNFMVFGMVQ